MQMSTHADDRRTMRAGAREARFYTSQPAPDQWIAVGTVAVLPRHAGYESTLRLLVGAGADEAAAIDNLRRRLDALEPSLA